jgi:hypothetical protein
MFNVSSATPGFRLGMANGAPGFRMQHFDSPDETYEMLSPMALLARNPYLRYADRGSDIDNWGASDGALVSAFGSAAGQQPLTRQAGTDSASLQAAAGSHLPSAVDAVVELCHNVGRAGPYCLYQCPDGRWVSNALYPTGPCPPFVVPGIGTSPWGDPPSPK